MTKTNKVIEKFQTICDAAQTIIDPMNDGERKQIKEIAEAVATSLQMETKRVLNCVNDFLHETEVGYVSRGKNGGFIKGKRAAKIVKAAPKVMAAPSSTSILDEDDSTDLAQ